MAPAAAAVSEPILAAAAAAAELSALLLAWAADILASLAARCFFTFFNQSETESELLAERDLCFFRALDLRSSEGGRLELGCCRALMHEKMGPNCVLGAVVVDEKVGAQAAEQELERAFGDWD